MKHVIRILRATLSLISATFQLIAAFFKELLQIEDDVDDDTNWYELVELVAQLIIIEEKRQKVSSNSFDKDIMLTKEQPLCNTTMKPSIKN